MSWITDFYAGFDDRVREIVAYGYANSTALRRRMDAAGLRPAEIQGVDGLARLPILRKEALITMQREGPGLGGMLTVPLSTMRRLFQSPGPIHEPEPDLPDPWRWAPALLAAGFGPGDIVLNTFGYHLTPAGAMFEGGAQAAGCTVVPGGVGNQAQQIEAIEALGITAFIGLPSYLKALLDRARATGHDPRTWRLTKAFVAAEPLTASLRAAIEAEGITVFQGYGTAECGNLGFEGPSRQGWHLPTDALVQVCDLDTGQPLPPGAMGEVVVTLFRRDYILVRFGVGDLSALIAEPSPDPIPTPRLIGWLGRSGDSVKVRGLFVHPRHVDEAVRGVAGVASYQAVVTREDHRDELTCRIAVLPGANASALLDAVGAALQEALKLRCRVELGAVPEDAKRFVDERTWE